MKKEKWLKREIDDWVSQGLISPEAALRIKSAYLEKEAPNTLVIAFSVVGAILIGAGIILIFARNWYELPVWFRVVLSFLPLVAGQGLAALVAFKHRTSIAWREGVAIFLALAVFANLALIDQIFHLPGSFGNYVLTCALLILPVIYILDAVGPALVYCWAILNWAGLNTGAYAYEAANYRVWWLLPLMALVAPYIVAKIRNERKGVRGQLLLWATALSGFFATLFLNMGLTPLGGGLLAAALCFYFSLLYAWGAAYEDAGGLEPLKVVGALGIFILLYMYSYFGTWGMSLPAEPGLSLSYLPNLALALAMLLFSVRLLLRFKWDSLATSLPLASVLLGLLLVLCHGLGLDMGFAAALLVNGMVGAVSILIIVRGFKDTDMLYANIGMITLCLLIVLRFFDWEMDFLARGIAFVALGAAFLGVNLFLIKKRKAVPK